MLLIELDAEPARTSHHYIQIKGRTRILKQVSLFLVQLPLSKANLQMEIKLV